MEERVAEGRERRCFEVLTFRGSWIQIAGLKKCAVSTEINLASADKIGIFLPSLDPICQPNEKKSPANLNYPSRG
jgi:hypothetical protein